MPQIEVRPPQTPDEWDQYYELHYRVLREPLGMPRRDQDVLDDKALVYAAAFAGGRVASIARLKPAPHEGPATAQVRGVATDPAWFRKGLGRAVMAFVEAEARRAGMEYLFLNARIGALDFYLDLGYAIEKDIGEYLPGVPHFRMGKRLA